MVPPHLNKLPFALALIALFTWASPRAVLAEPTFQDAFEQQHAVLLLIDPNSGEIVDANGAASNFYGFSRDTLRNMTIQEINQFTPKQVAEERKLAETEGRNFFIFRHKLADGDIRTVEVHSVPLDFDGRTLLFSVIHDISKQRSLQDDLWHYQTRLEDMVDQKSKELEQEHHQSLWNLIVSVIGLSILVVLLLIVMRLRHQSDEALRSSEVKQRSILNSAAEGIYGLDSHGHCTFANPACVNMLGFDDESELLGQPMHPLIHHTHADGRVHKSEDCPIHKAYTEGRETHDEDDIFWRKDGTSFPVEYWAHPLFEQGKLVGSVLTFVDISERKKAAQLLLEAKQNAELANRAKSDFLASMSHDLRTPLNAVLGFAQLLAMDTQAPLTDKQKEQVDRILDGGNHLLALVNDILDIAKVESDQVSILLNDVSANDVVAECTEMAESLGRARGIEVINTLPDGPDTLLRTDKQRIVQVLLNLITNAIKFNDAGGNVTISGNVVTPGYLRISVTDTGVGIPEDEHDVIFEMFHRLDDDPHTAHEGTGIGLTITRMLIERLGGQIGCNSQVGVGSTFWIDVPLASNTDALVWSDSIRIGLEPLDRDHQNLISLLNKLTLCGDSIEVTEQIIAALEDYTQNHFKREEVIMELCGYDQLDAHKKNHKEIIETLTGLATRWRKNKDHASRQALEGFLRQWLAGHIMIADGGLTECVRGQEQRIKSALQEAHLM